MGPVRAPVFLRWPPKASEPYLGVHLVEQLLLVGCCREFPGIMYRRRSLLCVSRFVEVLPGSPRSTVDTTMMDASAIRGPSCFSRLRQGTPGRKLPCSKRVHVRYQGIRIEYCTDEAAGRSRANRAPREAIADDQARMPGIHVKACPMEPPRT